MSAIYLHNNKKKCDLIAFILFGETPCIKH